MVLPSYCCHGMHAIATHAYRTKVDIGSITMCFCLLPFLPGLFQQKKSWDKIRV